MQPQAAQGLTVSQRFDAFLKNIALTSNQVDAGTESREKVVAALNSHYWNSSSRTLNSLYVGSWGKKTRVRPPRDVDVLFKLPYATYERFSRRTGNIQSQLLQEVKSVLSTRFPTTALKGDGPVVMVPFAAYNVELIPAFELNSGDYFICMTDNGGRYKTADYGAEEEVIRQSVEWTSGNVRPLIRMMKRWQANCYVPLKSFWIELLAVEFLRTYEHRAQGKMFYDWMVRDFLRYLETKRNGVIYAPGTYEAMFLGDAWCYRAGVAWKHAEKACEYEGDYPALAGGEWQKIFGTDIPVI